MELFHKLLSIINFESYSKTSLQIEGKEHYNTKGLYDLPAVGFTQFGYKV